MAARVLIFLLFILSINKSLAEERQCQVDNCQSCSLDEKQCIQCDDQFFLSSDGSNCNRCSTNCLNCTQSKCIQCQNNFKQDKTNLFKCIELEVYHQQETQTMIRKLEEERVVIEEGCHYTCQTCQQKGQESFCLSCPNTRYLNSFQGHKYGRCLCNTQSQVDTGSPECQDVGKINICYSEINKNTKITLKRSSNQNKQFLLSQHFKIMANNQLFKLNFFTTYNDDFFFFAIQLIQQKGFGINSFNILSYVIQGLFFPTIILTSIAGANGTFLFLLIETAQSYNMLLYLNSHNSGNMDQFLESFKFAHLDKFFPPLINQVYKYFQKQQPITGNPKILFDNYNSDNTLTNNWMYLTVILALAVITLILNKAKPNYSSNEQNIIKWTKYMTFSLPLFYFYATFQSVFMQTIYTFFCFNNKSSLGQTGLAFSFLQFFSIVGIAIYLSFIFVKQIKNEWIYLFFSVFKDELKQQRLFLVWQFIKKILVASIVVGIYYSSTAQATILFLIQLVNEFYIFFFKPLQNQEKPVRRKFIICHQILIIIIHLLFVFKQGDVSSFGFDMFVAVLIIIDLLVVSIKGITISIKELRTILVQSFYELKNEEVPKKIEQNQDKLPQEFPQDQINISINMTQFQKDKSISLYTEKQSNFAENTKFTEQQTK